MAKKKAKKKKAAKKKKGAKKKQLFKFKDTKGGTSGPLQCVQRCSNLLDEA